MKWSDIVRGVEDGASPGDAQSQLAGMAVMLTVTRNYLPDTVLSDLVQRLGGPKAYVGALLAIAFDLPEFGLRDELLEYARDVLHRLEGASRPESKP